LTTPVIDIAPNVEVVKDSEPAALEGIQPGGLVKVTEQAQGEQEFAVKIKDVARMSMQEDAVSDDAVEGVFLTLTDATEITVAGEPASRHL
jgi:hypothetical protein